MKPKDDLGELVKEVSRHLRIIASKLDAGIDGPKAMHEKIIYAMKSQLEEHADKLEKALEGKAVVEVGDLKTLIRRNKDFFPEFAKKMRDKYLPKQPTP